MQSRPIIGLFDSGVGGLSVWREVVRLLPEATLIYVADQAHVPYGSRSLRQVRHFAEGITRFLLAQGVEVVVLGSNTISAAALHHLRALFPATPFVGMEPAVKPAAQQTKSGVVGVMATQVTFQGDLFASLVDRYAGTVRVCKQICPGLVKAVESGTLDSAATGALLQTYVSPLLVAGADQIVLGCTHYPFLRPTIERLVNGAAAIIDPAPAVARQTVRVLRHRRQAGGALSTPRPQPHIFYTSGRSRQFTERLTQLLPALNPRSFSVQPVAWQPDNTLCLSHITTRQNVLK